MSDKKNIDRLFQEKFKDFEVEPNEQIWINIDAALREKKKRRVIPIWFKLTGIAAGLVLGFFVFNSLFNNLTLPQSNPVVIESKKQSNDNNSIESQRKESVVNTDNPSKKMNIVNSTNSSSINQENNSTTDSASENNNAVVNQTKSQKSKNQKINSRVSSEKSDAIVTTSTQLQKSSLKKKSIRNSIAPQNQDDAIANSKLKSDKIKKTLLKASSKSNNSHQEKDAIAVTNKDNLNSNTTNRNAILNGSENQISDEKKSNSSIAVNQKQTYEKNSIAKDEFKKTEAATTDLIKDSTALAAIEPNALEELLRKNEEERNRIVETKINRWQITSNVAPIYFGSTSNGSPIDDQFAENSKSYENNLSFGIGVNYAVNKKISVRTGINKFTLGYSTNDVVFFPAMDQQSFGSVSSSHAGSTIQVVSENNSEALKPFDNGIQNTTEGTMTQRMGYFEVPVEMSYKLLDQKFGISVIGGLSTLFLNENKVSVASSTMSASLGKASNLNDIHFSTNIGIGFKYRFWKSFEANFEPMFKYQINTFNKDAGNFKPYFIGLYSGVSFNF